MKAAPAGETYNIGGDTQWRNIDLVHRLCEIVAEETHKSATSYTALIAFIADRPGHDNRYAIDCTKIKRELGWAQNYQLNDGLRHTVHWYIEYKDWVMRVSSCEYRKWIDLNYTRLQRKQIIQSEI